MISDEEKLAITVALRLEAKLLWERFGPNARYSIRPLTAEEQGVLDRAHWVKMAILRRGFPELGG